MRGRVGGDRKVRARSGMKGGRTRRKGEKPSADDNGETEGGAHVDIYGRTELNSNTQ